MKKVGELSFILSICKIQWLPDHYQSIKFCLGKTTIYLPEKALLYQFTEDQKILWIWFFGKVSNSYLKEMLNIFQN